jgi:valyl-tRNA synthetase
VGSEAARGAVKERHRKQHSKLDQDLSRLVARLRDAAFLAKAPRDVVEADRAREQELVRRRATLERYLAGLRT